MRRFRGLNRLRRRQLVAATMWWTNSVRKRRDRRRDDRPAATPAKMQPTISKPLRSAEIRQPNLDNLYRAVGM
jgi:hypothetical protein